MLIVYIIGIIANLFTLITDIRYVKNNGVVFSFIGIFYSLLFLLYFIREFIQCVV